MTTLHDHQAFKKGLLWLGARMAAAIVSAWSGALTAQTTWYVATGGVDVVSGGTNWNTPFATIAYAVSQAGNDSGDLILVSNGVYNLSSYIEVNKNVVIKGVNTPGLTNTIINGGGVTHGFYLRHSNAVLDGLMITNGLSTLEHGGAVFMTNGAVRNCIIAFNRAVVSGGGIYLNPAGLISNCVIHDNFGGGGGIYGGGGVCIVGGRMYDCTIGPDNVISNAAGGGVHAMQNAWIVDCDVFGNQGLTANGHGGGVAVRNSPSGPVILSNTTVRLNCGVYGGGISVFDCETAIYGGSISGNTGNYGAGVVIMRNASVAMSGVALCDNVATSTDGGGVYVYGRLAVVDGDIRGNRAARAGGAICISQDATGICGVNTVAHSRITGNILNGNGVNNCYGAGMRVGNNWGGLVVDGCEISGNVISNANYACGGGISMTSNCVVRNSLVTGNSAEGAHGVSGGNGGGIYLPTGMSNLLESLTIVSNYCRLYGGGLYMDAAGTDLVVNAIVCSNLNLADDNYKNWYMGNGNRKTNVTFTCTPDADVNWGVGCINVDPMFADPGAGNYRLQARSPCVNAGTNMEWMSGTFDLDGYRRLDRFLGLVDMGCYEYVSRGTLYLVR